jgi:hypothetical protein
VVNFPSQGTGLPPHYSNLSRLGVETTSLEAINIRSRIKSAPDSPPSGSENSEQYSTLEIEAAKRIQKFWRFRIPLLRALRLFRDSPRGRAIAFFTKLANTHCSTLRHKLETRYTLLTEGVELCLKLAHLEGRIDESRICAMEYLRNKSMATSQLETLDDVISHIGEVDEVAKYVATAMSEAPLAKLLEGDQVNALQSHLRGLRRMIESAGRDTAEIKKGCDRISGAVQYKFK